MELSGLPDTLLVVFPSLFFWPALDNQQAAKKKKKSKVNRRKGSKSATGQSTVSHQKPDNIGSPTKSMKLLGHPPIVAHQPPPALPGRSEPEAISSQQLSSATSLHTSEDELLSPSEANSSTTSCYDTVPNLAIRL